MGSVLTTGRLTAAALGALVWSGTGQAQVRPSRAVAVATGLSLFSTGEENLSGTLYAARLALPIRLGFVIEPGLAYADYSTYGTAHLLPEVSLQLLAPTRVIRPYLGAGVGLAAAVRGPDPPGVTLHLTGGFWVRVSELWRVALEVRSRLQLGRPEGASWFDLVIGLARRF